jgi:hypothetical protein
MLKEAHKTLLYSRRKKGKDRSRASALDESCPQLATARVHKKKRWTIFAPEGKNCHICVRIDGIPSKKEDITKQTPNRLEEKDRPAAQQIQNEETEDAEHKAFMAKLSEKAKRFRKRFRRRIYKRDMDWVRLLDKFDAEFLKQRANATGELLVNLRERSNATLTERFEAFANDLITRAEKHVEPLTDKSRKESEEKSERIRITKRRLNEICNFLVLKFRNKLDEAQFERDKVTEKNDENEEESDEESQFEHDERDAEEADEETSSDSQEDEPFLSSSEDEEEHFYDGRDPQSPTVYDWLQKNSPRHVIQEVGASRFIRVHRHLLNDDGTWMKTSRDIKSSVDECMILGYLSVLWERLQASGRQLTRADTTLLAQRIDMTHGSWMLFTDETRKAEVNWTKITTALIEGQLLSHKADVSLNDGSGKHVISIETDDFTNFDEVCAHEKSIRDIGIRGQMLYKLSIHSHLKIYKGHHNIRPSVYKSDYEVGIDEINDARYLYELSRVTEFDI